MGSFLLSVVIPVYNEKSTVRDIVRRVDSVPIEKEIIIVDDFSTDGTRELLAEMVVDSVKLVLQPRNLGKGAALRTGFQFARGQVVIIQDADLEYDPHDFVQVISPIRNGQADVVYGSRFLGQHEFSSLSHYLGNRGLTWLTNAMFGSRLTDMETCYKAFRTELLLSLPLTANRFDFEPEVTALLLKRGLEIREVPISYSGRAFSEGKKISWRDGIAAVKTLLRCRFADETSGVKVTV